MNQVIIRKLIISEVPSIVDIHQKTFPNFFLTFLGSAFLLELYTAILSDPSGIFFVYKNVDQVLGFVAGTDQPAGFYSRLLRRRWWRFALASIKPALKQPIIIPRLLRAINKPSQAESSPDTGTLMSIGVSPKAQGRGIGKDLVQTFLQEAADRGLKWVNLTTDKDNNDRVNTFYQNLGFSCVRSYTTPEGRIMNEYLIALG
jgi:ribosomal protein S18 acetylase RimI-like enzyme